MATGLEVLGAVSAVCALVSFARETISVCKRVYNGESTANEDLKKHAEQMSEAIAWVQTRCMGIRELFREGARLTREFATKLVSCHDMEKFDLESAIASVSGKGLRVICPLCHWTSEDIFPRALDT
ncbi:hypothetical protein NOF04DRAFT_6543 [Fusarium oxysporum II5]|uniref:Fungal N-terminal domain-containing protein n=2 Tax=Fusarium oxysporum species complex TaxID=171631 RepID=X0JA83_FUSO5|nr:uncharacterized protein FOIG_09690 [Fusarium odoratissimum NRRL 54006]EXL98133.1 hypothetical protein FOIG_09690 [Fusarium odoratissimum NRRL 54006]KAK2124175.1 hypothetical protein NOF04DRAFT_6543 [Fusarium oxysporum II5]TXB95537.1 hypothetical protein FocTR4_00016639 [Fusarium oxysporum f. sp. cubense]